MRKKILIWCKSIIKKTILNLFLKKSIFPWILARWFLLVTSQWWICFSCLPLFSYKRVFFGPIQNPHVLEFLCFCLFCNLCVDCVCKNDGVTKVENKKVFLFTLSFHGYGFIQTLRCIKILKELESFFVKEFVEQIRSIELAALYTRRKRERERERERERRLHHRITTKFEALASERRKLLYRFQVQ